MNTGALRHLVTLDVPNGATGTYTPLDPPTWWCAYLSETAGEATLIGRFHPGITTATRVHVKGRTFHVESVINREERDAELVVSISEVFA
jgi:hypothetical protein